MYTINELLFPHSAIKSLKGLREEEWESLVERILSLPETHEETLGFMLMMIRLDGCMACETDSYRAMRGCQLCAQQTIQRFKGTDAELLKLYEKALGDIRKYATKNPKWKVNSSA